METRMDPRERSKILDCFNERVERNCGVCQAHHSKGGSCCFGVQWEPNDDHCNECVHKEDCAYICQNTRRPPHQRNITTQGGSVSPSRTLRQPVPVEYQNSEEEEEEDEEIEVIQTDEPLIQRLGKDTLWGALTGGTKMMYQFFKTRRWR